MKTRSCIFMSLALVCCSCITMKNDILPQSIKEIWIYDYFLVMGRTTAGAYGEIIRLEEANTPKFKLAQNDVDSLCRILQETSSGKGFHTKLGRELVFAEIILANGKNLKAVIGFNVISVDVFQKNYWVKDEKNIAWLNGFIDKMYKRHDTINK